MLRLTFLLRRKPEMGPEDFREYWRTRHGPLVAGVAAALNTRRYVQVHTLDDPMNAKLAEARGSMEPPYDGVAEMWWDDWDRLEESLSSAAGREAGRALVEDESRFIDLAQSPMWLGYEYPQVNPTPEILLARPRSSLVKLYFPLRHHASLSLAEAQRYWHTRHGPLIRSQAAAAGILRYVQVHRVEHPLEAALRAARGTEAETYTGHAELWLDRNHLPRGPEARAAGARAIEDEARFIDFARSSIWVAKEHTFVDHTQGD